jgi:hypothetical protein
MASDQYPISSMAPPLILEKIDRMLVQDMKTIIPQVTELRLHTPEASPKISPAQPASLKHVYASPEIFLTGFGTHYPPHLGGLEEQEAFVRGLYDVDGNAG